MENMTPLRLRVAELRGVKGWTQAELAKKAGVDRVTIARIEGQSPKRVDFAVLEKLADALGVEPGYLVARSENGRRR